MIMINWSAFSGRPELEQLRCFVLFFIILAIFMNLLAGGGGAGDIDTMGHLGGSITGLLWGLAFFPRKKTRGSQQYKIAGLIGILAFFVIFTTLLFVQ